MLEGLQKKWKVGGWRLVLILITFAVGGSLTGYAGRKIMSQTGIETTVIYIPVYIIIVTVIWPFAVLLVSMFTGQFIFFKSYLGKMRKRLRISNREQGTRNNEGEAQRHEFKVESSKSNPDSYRDKSQKFNSAILEKNEETSDIEHQTSNLKHLVIFASGAGSNAQQLINYFRNSDFAKVVLIVCNKPAAGVISIAEKEAIPLLLIERERFLKGDGYLSELQNVKTDLVILAGFLWKIPQPIIDAYRKRIINIHPALLPKYGGKGMYGQYVHEAVINSGEVQSGITIHYVDEHYDNGDVIFQTGCPVLPGDTPETLAQRIHQLEHLHFSRVVEEVIRNTGE